jgi:hypothetical protein
VEHTLDVRVITRAARKEEAHSRIRAEINVALNMFKAGQECVEKKRFRDGRIICREE